MSGKDFRLRTVTRGSTGYYDASGGYGTAGGGYYGGGTAGYPGGYDFGRPGYNPGGLGGPRSGLGCGPAWASAAWPGATTVPRSSDHPAGAPRPGPTG